MQIERRGGLKRKEIATELRASILSGAFAPGTRLPGENELARQFSVSRTTIRGALEGLVEENLIDTQSGVGSFVTFDGLSLDQSPSWGRALAMAGVDAPVEILRFERIVDPDLAAVVGHTSMDFVALDRVRRLADGTAISLERSRVPCVSSLVTALKMGLVGGSLSKTMELAGLVAARGEQWISVAGLGADDASLLGRVPGELFLNTVRVALTADGRFAERVVSWLDPAHFRLHVSFGG